MRLEELRALDIFSGITDEQLAQLLASADEVPVEPGVCLFREGDHADYWWVLLDGAIDLVRRVGREDAVVARMDVAGRWAGGFRAWDDAGVYLASARGAGKGRVLRVPAEVLREWTDQCFPFGGHLIEGLYRTARTVEATARERQSLVALGTLAAGLAHELNNPAAAAARAADGLEGECGRLLATLERLAQRGISAEQFTALDALRRELTGRVVPADPLAAADVVDELSSWLADRGVARPWLLAAPLAAAGADVLWGERVVQAVRQPSLETALGWVAATLGVDTLLAEVKQSTHRVSDLVSAMKSYSQMDRAPLQRVDVTEGLESTLVLLGSRLGSGVSVVREYGPGLPAVDAYASELNQVWTNLIDNALDAMSGSGTLRLAVRGEDGDVVVEVADTGPGMAPEVAARAFEAFFTTKPVGKGTGLGLDIARRVVVERHGGSIVIDSHPAGTVLRVRLPARTPRLE